MTKASTPALALLLVGLFFCLLLQTVDFTLVRMVRDACLILQLSPPMTLLIITATSFVVMAGLALLTLQWLQRRSANGMTGRKMALGLALAYVLAVAFQFIYTYNFLDNTIVDAQEYAIRGKEYLTYLENLNAKHPLLLVAQRYAPLNLIYLLVAWRCLR